MDIPIEFAFKIASNLRDVAAFENLQHSIDEICALVHQFYRSPHQRIEYEPIWQSLNYMMNPALLDVTNAHDYFHDYHGLFICSSNPLLSEIGSKMLHACCHHNACNNRENVIDFVKETRNYIAYYAHHAGRNT